MKIKKSVSLLLGSILLLSGCFFKPASIVDELGLLTPGDVALVTSYQQVLLKSNDIDLRLVLKRVDGNLNSRSVTELATEMDLGEFSTKKIGILVLIDPSKKKVRIHINKALRILYSDVFINYIENQQMVPYFMADDLSAGIVTIVELIVNQAQLAKTDRYWLFLTQYNQLSNNKSLADNIDLYTQSNSPNKVLEGHLQSLQRGTVNTQSALYSNVTQESLSKWKTSKKQMQKSASFYKKCPKPQLFVSDDHFYAVLRYPLTSPHCSPWFFVNEQRWRLDLTAKERLIRFNQKNNWYFSDNSEHRYKFAFKDWAINQHGVPIKQLP